MTPEQIASIYDYEEPNKARDLLLPEAKNGNPVAQFYLGQLCTEENPRNDEGAVAWFEKSAASGYEPGVHYLASHLYFGIGISQDIEKALKLLRTSAESGFDASQWKLGQHLLSQPGSREEAVKWLELAANNGHPAAKDLLNANQDAYPSIEGDAQGRLSSDVLHVKKCCVWSQASTASPKSKVVFELVDILQVRMGSDAFQVIDHWPDDPMAIGIASPRNGGVLAYVSVTPEANDRYFVCLELPPEGKWEDHPYSPGDEHSGCGIDELVRIISIHLRRVKPDVSFQRTHG